MIFAAGTGYSAATDLAIFSVVVFIVLCVLLGWFLAPRLSKVMDRRQARILEDLRQAEIARQETERLIKEQREQAAKASEQAKAMLQQTRVDAERVKQEILDRAGAEAKQYRVRLEREIRLASRQVSHELLLTATRLSTGTAERILRSTLSEDDHRRLIDEAIEEIGNAKEDAA